MIPFDMSEILKQGQRLLNDIKRDKQSNCMDINDFNVNQLCYCRVPLKSYEEYESGFQCYCCLKWRHSKIFYSCNSGIKCKFKQIADLFYEVCGECFNSKTTVSENKSSYYYDEDQFISSKIESTIKIINNELAQIQNKKQRKEYLFDIYDNLYINWIEQLKNNRLCE
eukprot:27505_1